MLLLPVSASRCTAVHCETKRVSGAESGDVPSPTTARSKHVRESSTGGKCRPCDRRWENRLTFCTQHAVKPGSAGTGSEFARRGGAVFSDPSFSLAYLV